MVEAAFMMPMFVILFYASLYAENLGKVNSQSNRNSRQQAWTYAMANCGDTSGQDESEVLPPSDPGSGSGAATKLSPLTPGTGGPSGSNPLANATGALVSSIGSVFPDANGAQSLTNPTLNWRDPNLYNGNPGTATTQVNQHVVVNCNNAPWDGGAVQALYHLGQSFVNAISSF
jgi:hypothetical protein